MILVVKVNTTSQRITIKCNCTLDSDVTERVLLLPRVILQNNIAEYCPARDMVSTFGTSSTADKY